jgi:flavorubredoxin
VANILPVDRVRWLTFGHVEADECGSMNQWLAAAPQATVVHGATGVLVSLNDLADRPPRMAGNGEVVDLGGKRVRWLDTPHVPHAWEAGLLFEETTGTLFCGDLFTAIGPAPAATSDDILEPAMAAEDVFHATALMPATGPTIRGLADLGASTLALMHGPAFTGDVRRALTGLGDYYDGLVAAGGTTN